MAGKRLTFDLEAALRALSKAGFVDQASGTLGLGPNGVKLHANLVSVYQRYCGDATADFQHTGKQGFSFRTEEGTNGLCVAVTSDPCRLERAILLKDAGKKWAFSYQDQLRLRRKFWKELHFDPGTVSMVEKDARSANPTAKINSLLSNIELENVKVVQGQECEAKFHHLGAKDGDRVVVTQTKSMSSALALMLESVRTRLFGGGGQSRRLALHNDIVPHQVALTVLGQDPDLPDFRTYLTGMLEAKGIKVWDCSGQDFAYEACDELGVPFLVILNDDSLVDGVVNVRDRETTWFEQVHAAHLSQKLQHTFKSKITAADAYSRGNL